MYMPFNNGTRSKDGIPSCPHKKRVDSVLLHRTLNVTKDRGMLCIADHPSSPVCDDGRLVHMSQSKEISSGAAGGGTGRNSEGTQPNSKSRRVCVPADAEMSGGSEQK